MPLDMSDVTDDVLIVLYANGDGGAARVLATRHSGQIMGLAYRMLGDRDAAEDIVQEALLRLWKHAKEWRQGEAKLSTWLYRVASNLCIDQLRKRRNVDLDAIDEPADDAPSVEAQMQATARLNALTAALQSLPDRQRLAVTLRHIEELSNPEIAEIMEISVDAVESLTARGKRALAAAIAPMKEQIGFEK